MTDVWTNICTYTKLCVTNSDGAEPEKQLVQRQVIVQQDQRGYGFSVTGDNPVFIKTVKESKDCYLLSSKSA